MKLTSGAHDLEAAFENLHQDDTSMREQDSARRKHEDGDTTLHLPLSRRGGGSVDKAGAESTTPEERCLEQCASPSPSPPSSDSSRDTDELACVRPRSGHLEGALPRQGSGYSLSGYTGGLSVPSWLFMLPGSSAQREAGVGEANPEAMATVPGSTSVVAANEVSLQMYGCSCRHTPHLAHPRMAGAQPPPRAKPDSLLQA